MGYLKCPETLHKIVKLNGGHWDLMAAPSDDLIEAWIRNARRWAEHNGYVLGPRELVELMSREFRPGTPPFDYMRGRVQDMGDLARYDDFRDPIEPSVSVRTVTNMYWQAHLRKRLARFRLN